LSITAIARSAVAALALAAWTATAHVASPADFAAAGECDAQRKPARLDFKLKDVNGATVKLADFKGKVLVLNFWATWCVPCKTEIPDFVELQALHADAGLQMVGISADDTVKQLKPYLDVHKINYPILQGKGHDDLLDAYSVSSLPVTVVIDRAGAICHRYGGPITKDALARQIDTLF
jgi:peroxiredoxin